MIENFGRKEISSEDEGSDKRYSFEMIKADLRRFGDVNDFINALSVSSLLRGETVTDLQNRLTDTQNSGASLLIDAYNAVSKLFKENKLPKDAEWYSELQKRMTALDILMIGANFDPKFQDKAAEGFNSFLEKTDSFFEWLSKKGISMSQYGEMSYEEIDRCHHEFNTEVLKDLN